MQKADPSSPQTFCDLCWLVLTRNPFAMLKNSHSKEADPIAQEHHRDLCLRFFRRSQLIFIDESAS